MYDGTRVQKYVRRGFHLVDNLDDFQGKYYEALKNLPKDKWACYNVNVVIDFLEGKSNDYKPDMFFGPLHRCHKKRRKKDTMLPSSLKQ